jgi:hypothetical protein
MVFLCGRDARAPSWKNIVHHPRVAATVMTVGGSEANPDTNPAEALGFASLTPSYTPSGNSPRARGRSGKTASTRISSGCFCRTARTKDARTLGWMDREEIPAVSHTIILPAFVGVRYAHLNLFLLFLLTGAGLSRPFSRKDGLCPVFPADFSGSKVVFTFGRFMPTISVSIMRHPA